MAEQQIDYGAHESAGINYGAHEAAQTPEAPGYFETLKQDISSIPQMFRHPIDTAVAVAKQSIDHAKAAYGELQAGEYEKASDHLVGALPVLGPMVYDINEDIKAGNKGRALARLTELLGPKLVKGAPEAVSGAVRAGKAAAEVATDPGVLRAAAEVLPKGQAILTLGDKIKQIVARVKGNSAAPPATEVSANTPESAPATAQGQPAPGLAPQLPLGMGGGGPLRPPLAAPQASSAPPPTIPVETAPSPTSPAPEPFTPPTETRWGTASAADVEAGINAMRARKGLPPLKASSPDVPRGTSPREPTKIPFKQAEAPTETFEGKARAEKADATAKLMQSNGITLDEALKMEPDHWRQLAKAVDLANPGKWKGEVKLDSAATQAAVIDALQKMTIKSSPEHAAAMARPGATAAAEALRDAMK